MTDGPTPPPPPARRSGTVGPDGSLAFSVDVTTGDVVQSPVAGGPGAHVAPPYEYDLFGHPTDEHPGLVDDHDHHDNDDDDGSDHEGGSRFRIDDQLDRLYARVDAERLERRRARERRRYLGREQRRNQSAPRTVDDVAPAQRGRTDQRVELRGSARPRRRSHSRRSRELHADASQFPTSSRRVGTHSHRLGGMFRQPLHGVALAVYVAGVPLVLAQRWAAPSANPPLLHVVMVALGVLWVALLVQIGHNIVRLRRGEVVREGGSAWLAAGLLTLLPFFAAPHATPNVPHHAPAGHTQPAPAELTGAVALAMVARRLEVAVRQGAALNVDETIALLRERRPLIIGHVRALIHGLRDGVILVANDVRGPVGVTDAPSVAVVTGVHDSGAQLSFAHEGGRLRVPAHWSGDELADLLVGLHDGPLHVVRDERELLRTLATQRHATSLVVYVGDPTGLDQDVRAVCVTRCDEAEVPTPPSTETSRAPVVELLRADPRVEHLVEPFTPTLRRRCIEMVAYLSLHEHEPVTGDRLRTRVLTHADVDASTRTLANTATAVRRSLGVDDAGARLHPVTSAGLYQIHGVTSDVATFFTLVDRARRHPPEAATLLDDALALVQGEPLASALRGFEWFLAEGFAARLARDGEWAALALAHHYDAHGAYERAFWALQRGLLIDPYSNELRDAVARVPRLREFGGDGAGPAQHESVGPGRAVTVSWSLAGFTKQVSQ